MSSVERREPNRRLWQAMTDAGVSPAELAKTVGVDPKTVERWVTTGRAPYPVHRYAVGKAIGASVEELWPGQARRERKATPDANEVLREAIFQAEMTPDRLAERLNVDPKTVERWVVKGRLPYARHRAEVAELVQVPEAELWPQQARALHERMTGNDPAGVWDRWAEKQIRARADEQRARLGLLPSANTPAEHRGNYRTYSRGHGVERSQ